MKSIWRKKWLVAVIAVAIFLSVGAVAWAAASDDGATDTAPASTAPAGGAESLIVDLTEGLGDDSAAVAETVAAGAKAMRQRAEKWIKRQEALMAKLRESMSPADQALYDKLVATAKEQREILKEARKNLADTVKQIKQLRDKYLDGAPAATN